MEIILYIIRGFCMGIADLVPGVSGGTIAFLLGIYQQFIQAITSISIFFKRIIKGEIKESVKVVHWRVLIPLGIGIITAIITLSSILKQLLETRSVEVYAFFFGLIIVSVYFLWMKIPQKKSKNIIWGGVSIIIFSIIMQIKPVEIPHSPWILILSGTIAISAMILPGISGSFILLILGQYEYIINLIHSRDIVQLSYFLIGIGIGVLVFVPLLSKLLEKYYSRVLSILLGIVIASLPVIWPWKTIKGQIMIPEINMQIMVPVICFVIGGAIATVLIIIEKKRI